MIYDQLYVSTCMHIKSNAWAVFSIQVVLSKTTRVNNTIGKSINLLKCVCHASLSFIDPFNNPIIKLMGYVLKELICLTPSAMRRRYVY